MISSFGLQGVFIARDAPHDWNCSRCNASGKGNDAAAAHLRACAIDAAGLVDVMDGPQPAPKPGTAPATWNLVMADMRKRDRMGAAKYGVRHQHDNGRDHLRDAYEEALDLAVYLRAEIERRDAK